MEMGLGWWGPRYEKGGNEGQLMATGIDLTDLTCHNVHAFGDKERCLAGAECE